MGVLTHTHKEKEKFKYLSGREPTFQALRLILILGGSHLVAQYMEISPGSGEEHEVPRNNFHEESFANSQRKDKLFQEQGKVF